MTIPKSKTSIPSYSRTRKKTLSLKGLPALGCAVILAISNVPGTLHAEKFPADANLVDITAAPYNAIPNDAIDDTPAIRAAIETNVSTGKIIYFPNGTYLISDSLEWKRADRSWWANLSFQGESRSGTILKLIDNLPAYNTGTAKAIIKTGSTLNNVGLPERRADGNLTSGGGNEAFRNSFYDLTVDAGSGNPDAIGIDWAVSNRGVIRNVTIRSAGPGRVGKAGVSLLRDVGPGLMQNVTIEGFDIGIQGGSQQYSSTFQKVTLNNQNGVGVLIGPGVYNFEELHSSISAGSANTQPVVVYSSANGQLTLINSTFTRGTSSTTIPAIDAGGTPTIVGRVFLRNVTSTGYASALKSQGTIQPGANIVEWVSHTPLKSFASDPSASLNLPIEQPPAVFGSANFTADWANVNTFPNGGLSAAKAGDTIDDTTAIQNAMNSGKRIVYFPKANAFSNGYLISQTITVPDTVERITAGENFIFENGTTPAIPASSGLFRIVGSASAPPLTIERFWSGGTRNRAPIILNDSQRVVYIRDVSFGGSDSTGKRSVAYRNTAAGTGKLFIDDCFATVRADNPQQVWARQLNSEAIDSGNTNVGGSFWVLGVKTEADITVFNTTNGSTEVLGGFLMCGVGTGANHPVLTPFIGSNARQSLSFTIWTSAVDDYPPIYVSETRGGLTGEVTLSEVPLKNAAGSQTSRSWVPLYICNAPITASVVQESAAYTAGALNGLNGGTGWGGAWTAAGGVNVTSGSIAYTGLATSGNKIGGANALTASRNLSSVISADGTKWIAVMVNRTGTPSVSFTNVFLRNSANVNQIRLYNIQHDARWLVQVGTQTSPFFTSTNPALFLLKVTFKPGNDDVTVWVNPNLVSGEAGLGAGYTFTGAANLSLSNLFLQFSGTSGGSVDEFRIGNTLGEAIGQ